MRWLLLLAALVAFSTPAEAHKPSDSYLALSVNAATIDGQWDIALRDLDFAIGLDRDDDGAISWGELKIRFDAIASYAFGRLKLQAGGAVCPLQATDRLVDRHSDGAYAVLRFTATCPLPPRELDVAYSLLFDVDPQHRGLLRLEHQATTQTAVLAPGPASRRFELGRVPLWTALRDYGVEGVWHIWIGFDHVLFLLTLLLPAVLRRERERERWQAASAMRPVVVGVVKIVTAFTVSHSLTLSLAALGYIALPTRLVESAIAASVIAAAINNIWPVVTARLWLVAFAFGLVHGLGFATVLIELGLPPAALIAALLGFNLGVEIGQLAIVLMVLPVVYGLRSWPLYPRVALQAGSLLVAAIASLWLIERAFALAP